MDDEIEVMCGCGWTLMFVPGDRAVVAGSASHLKYGVVEHRQSNTRKLTERLFLMAQELDPVLRALVVLW